MIGYKQTLLVLLITMLSGVTVAQNNTNSPYTRYGYGQLEDQGSGNSKGMGGIAYGLRDKYQTNFVNPASYTAVDSLTFIFDGGISLQNTNFSDGKIKQNAKNSSFDYITMQFRASKWMAISLGMLPYSNVGYSMGKYQEDPVNAENSSATVYSGEGGLHQLYLGAGFKILKNLSVGANFSYLWGDITRTTQTTFPSNSDVFPFSKMYNVAIKSHKLDFGAQYTQQFGKKHAATLGVVFSPGHNLKNDSYVKDTKGNASTGVTVNKRDTVASFGIPTTLGIGLTYVYDQRLTLGIDAMLQNWDKVTYMNEKKAFSQRQKISFGAEYLPNPMGRSYLAHVKYRLGAYYSRPYYKIKETRAADEYGVTAGFGLPIPRTRSLLSISAQYVRTQGTQAAFLNENTLRICVGITFNERWFFKRKVN